MNIGDLSIGARLGLGTSLAVAGLAATITRLSVATPARNIRTLAEEKLPYALLAERMSSQVVQAQQFLSDVAATHDAGALEAPE